MKLVCIVLLVACATSVMAHQYHGASESNIQADLQPKQAPHDVAATRASSVDTLHERMQRVHEMMLAAAAASAASSGSPSDTGTPPSETGVSGSDTSQPPSGGVKCLTAADCCKDAQCIVPRGSPLNQTVCVLAGDKLCEPCATGRYVNGVCTSTSTAPPPPAKNETSTTPPTTATPSSNNNATTASSGSEESKIAHIPEEFRPHPQPHPSPDADNDLSHVIKSPGDEREYLRFRLDSGLDVLLVHDNLTTKAAAAMDVGVGYWKDPADIPGLAHFLEHMLFLGTKKYPTEDSYSGFLSAHGGSSNAFTSMQNTNFYFDVQPQYLKDTLDRFGQFFIAPLFTASSTNREMHAVESEHSKNLQSDSWRTFQLIQSLANASHPFHKFGTGSTKTLGSVDPIRLRTTLIKFWGQHYYARNMRLVVVGRESLEDLRKMVTEVFGTALPTEPRENPEQLNSANQVPPASEQKPVSNKQASSPASPSAGAGSPAAKPSFLQLDESVPTKYTPIPFPVEDTSQQIFSSDVLGSLVVQQTVKDVRQLTFVFMLPPQTRKYHTKSLEYIAILLGGEGKGSLLSLLKHKGLATGLSAGSDLSTGAFELVQIDIDLTVAGTSSTAIRQIAEAMFDYIRLIESKGIEKWRFTEMAAISAIHFRVKNKETSSDYASKLAAKMSKVRPRDILSSGSLWDTFDPAAIHQLLGLLVPEKCLVMLSMQKPPIDLPKTEQWYGTRYAMSKLPDSDLKSWRSHRQGSNTSVDASMQLPGANMFLPKSLAIKNGTEPVPPHPPVIIMDRVDTTSPVNGSMRVWFKQDFTFERPRANAICKLWSGDLYGTPRDVVLSSMYTKLVKDALSEKLYPASVAGFTYSFSSDVDGMDLRITGFDSGLDHYVGEIASHLRLLSAADAEKAQKAGKPIKGVVALQHRFHDLREQLTESYRNFMFSQPHMHAGYAMSLLLEEPHWHISQYMAAIKFVTLEDVIEWGHGMWQDVGIECLMHGNIDKAEAKTLSNTLLASLEYSSNSRAMRSMSNQIQRVTEVDGAYTFYMDVPNPNEANSACYAYLQYGASNTTIDVLTQLVSMIMEKPVFHQLRTVEQLGYIVWSGADTREGVNGLRVIVQSATRDAAYLHTRVDATLKKVQGIMHNMTDKQFATFVSTLARTKMQRPRTLAEQSARFWYEISTQEYNFNRRWHESAALKNVTQPQTIAFYDQLVGSEQDVASRITVQANSQKKQHKDSKDNKSTEYQGTVPKQGVVDGSKISNPQVQPRPQPNGTVSIPKHTKPVIVPHRSDGPSFVPDPHLHDPALSKSTALLELSLVRISDMRVENIECGKKAVKKDPRCDCAHRASLYVPNADACEDWVVKAIGLAGAKPVASATTATPAAVKNTTASVPVSACACPVANQVKCPATCPPPAPAHTCGVSAWGPWTPCVNGTKFRQRKMIGQPTGHCPFLLDMAVCPLPVDCVTSAWSKWSACTNGLQTHNRTIEVQPAYGGAACGDLEDTATCTPPPPAPLSSRDMSCPKRARRTHAPAKLSLHNIAAFKNAMCLFPRRAAAAVHSVEVLQT
jgi:insulysin